MILKSSFLFAVAVGVAQSGNFLFPRPESHHSRTVIGNWLLNARGVSSKVFQLSDIYEGQNFFDGWDFFQESDPTHGSVNYLSKDDAQKSRLAFVQDGKAVVAVDDFTSLPLGANRDSVRISTKKVFNGGLFIADFDAMPFGCSTWPAYWSIGPGWPNGGEIDIIEGQNNQQTNQYTLHSGGGCTLDTGDNNEYSGSILGRKCASEDGDNAGCAFSDPDTRSYGAGFNGAGGGVFVHLWDDSGIRIWHFARNDVPADISSRNPNPANWPTPQAFFSSSSCDMASHFHDHVLTIDTTLCGDWAGAAYTSSGCPSTCPQLVMDPTNFVGAKWKVNYIAIYQ